MQVFNQSILFACFVRSASSFIHWPIAIDADISLSPTFLARAWWMCIIHDCAISNHAWSLLVIKLLHVCFCSFSSSKRVQNMARALSPALFRLGGTSADEMIYDVSSSDRDLSRSTNSANAVHSNFNLTGVLLVCIAALHVDVMKSIISLQLLLLPVLRLRFLQQ